MLSDSEKIKEELEVHLALDKKQIEAFVRRCEQLKAHNLSTNQFANLVKEYFPDLNSDTIKNIAKAYAKNNFQKIELNISQEHSDHTIKPIKSLLIKKGVIKENDNLDNEVPEK